MEKIFPSTSWTLIREKGTDTPEGRAALETLCKRYRPAVLEYSKLRGLDDAAAEDLTQEFLAELSRDDGLVKPENIEGSFGAYVRGCVKNLIAKHWRHANALKRGGGVAHHSVDADPAILEEPALVWDTDADRLFDQVCIRHQFQLAVRQLEARYRERGSLDRWEVLRPFLTDEGDYEVASRELGLEVVAVRAAAKRMRDGLRRELSALAGDVAAPGEGEEEMRRWLRVLASG